MLTSRQVICIHYSPVENVTHILQVIYLLSGALRKVDDWRHLKTVFICILHFCSEIFILFCLLEHFCQIEFIGHCFIEMEVW